MEWELSKENVQPMKAGRNVDVLNDALKVKAEGHARSSIFENQRRQMLDDIEHYTGDDPLQPWIRCIKWIKDAFPAGGAQSELLKLLEGCTRTFQKDELYRNDVRYLRVWVQYADCCTDPIDVFAFLENNNIGQTYALFYEAYATSMELRRNFTKADEIYRIGISRQAQPLGRLENMYKNFLSRMARRGERKIREEQQLLENGSTLDTENQIRAFGSTSRYPEQQYGRERERQVLVQPPYPRSNKPKNTKIPVFVDPEFKVSRNPRQQDLDHEDPGPGPSRHQSGPWYNLPVEGDKKKENVQQPSRWTEAKIKQNLPSPHVRHSALDVYVDEEFSEASNLKGEHKPVTAAPPPILRFKLEDMQSLKRTSPRLRGSFLDISSTALDSVNKYEGPGVTAGQGSSHHPKTAVPSVLAYDAPMITANGAEKCFEEVRLEVWKGNNNHLLDPAPDEITERYKDEGFVEPVPDVLDTEKTVQLDRENADETSGTTSDSPVPMVVEMQKEATHMAGGPSSCNGASVQSHENQMCRNECFDQRVSYDAPMITANGAEKCFEEVRLEVWKGNNKYLLDPAPDEITEIYKDEGFVEPVPDVLDTEKTVQLDRENADETSASTSDSPVPAAVETQEGSHKAGYPRSYNGATAQSDENQIGRNESSEHAVDGSGNESASNGTGSTNVSEQQLGGSLSPLNRSSDRPLSIASSFSVQGDETIAIKRFADEIIVLGADPRVNGLDANSHHGLVDQTINTKECIADILDMFNKPLESDKSRSKARLPRDSKKRTSGFQIYVDEELQTPRPLEPGKDEKRAKASSSNAGGAGQRQIRGFQVYRDENLADERPVRSKATVADTSTFIDVSKKSQAESRSFQDFEDENLGVQPGRPKQNHRRTDVSRSSGSRSKDLQIFVDDEFCAAMPVQPEKRIENSSTAPQKSVDPFSGRSSFQIYEDEEMKLNSSEPIQPDSRINTSATRSSIALGVFVDDNFRDLSLNARLPEEPNFDKTPQLKPLSPEDKENVPVPCVGRPFGIVGVSSPAGASKGREDIALEKNKATEVTPSERSPLQKSTCSAYVADSAPIAVIPVTVGERPQSVSSPVDVDPWDEHTLKCLLSKIQTSLSNYEIDALFTDRGRDFGLIPKRDGLTTEWACKRQGYFESNTKYDGPLPTSSMKASNGRNKIIELGSSTYRLKGYVGEGAFAHVFEAEDIDDDYYDDPPKIVLKFQKPACPWEFYIYRQLDQRISKHHRRYYGYARRMHLYKDCSFMICDYGEKGTLQDVLNAYLAVNQHMEEVVCMFYTIEMLRMLEVLHSVGIIHGDIKPDNFLIRDERDERDSLVLGDWDPEHPGCWKSLGLCLIDWGRSIDVTLFPNGTMFHGDCKTDSFRCPEMLERRPWSYQVDTFGLCGVVHCLLHGSYMQIEKIATAEGQTLYRPKAAFKRYWNVKLWKKFFDTLLNVKEFSDGTLLTRLRQSFERHLMEKTLEKKLKGSIIKQTVMMFTARRRK